MIGNDRQPTERLRRGRGARPGRGDTARVFALVLILALVLSLATLEATPPSTQKTDSGKAQLELSQAVPSDMSVYFHARMPSAGSGRVALDAVRRALSAASFLPPFANYLDEVVLASKRSALDPELEYWRRILERTSWWRLFSTEFFLAGRLEIERPDLDLYRRAWLMGCRIESGEREPFLSDFQELLEAFAAIIPGSQMDVGRRDGSAVICLYSLVDPSLEFCVTGCDGLVLMATSRSLLRHSLQLLEGSSSDIPFALRRAGELQAGSGSSAGLSPEAESFAWLASQSKFFGAISVTAEAEPAPGFELTVRPLELFADALGDDPLLSDWKSLYVAGDFREDALRCYFDTDLQAGQEELARVLYRSLVEPFDRPSLAPVLYKEVGAFLPQAEDQLEPPEVTVLARELARWLKAAIDVLDTGERRAVSETVTVRGGKRLRGEATLPLALRQSAGTR